jgi:hypothetical protein
MVPLRGGAHTWVHKTSAGNEVIITFDESITDKDVKVHGLNRNKMIDDPVFIILGHELIHALHWVNGKIVIQPSRNPRFKSLDSGEEEQTILTGHPSENDLRRENGLPLRGDDDGDDRRKDAL